MESSNIAVLLLSAAFAIFLYCGGLIVQSSSVGTVLLALADVSALGGIIGTFAKRGIKDRKFFVILFVSSIAMVSFTLGIKLKYIHPLIPYSLRIFGAVFLGICCIAIIVSGNKLYPFNTVAKVLFLGGFAVCLATQIFFLTYSPANILVAATVAIAALSVLAFALICMSIGIIHGTIKYRAHQRMVFLDSQHGAQPALVLKV